MQQYLFNEFFEVQKETFEAFQASMKIKNIKWSIKALGYTIIIAKTLLWATLYVDSI